MTLWNILRLQGDGKKEKKAPKLLALYAVAKAHTQTQEVRAVDKECLQRRSKIHCSDVVRTHPNPQSWHIERLRRGKCLADIRKFTSHKTDVVHFVCLFECRGRARISGWSCRILTFLLPALTNLLDEKTTDFARLEKSSRHRWMQRDATGAQK